MSTRLTLFTATLVQDSALSVAGLDRESAADQPFTLVDGVPTLVGRGLKGAAVAMAKRFFDPLPRAVSDDIKHGTLRRSAWEFADATTAAPLRLRAGVGIRHKTGARAGRVLYDREVVPAGTRWLLEIRVDRTYTLNDAEYTEAEGILGYVLLEHWAKGRCWLGGDVARGLGWCHLEDLKAYRFDDDSYEAWVQAGRPREPSVPPVDLPTVQPTRSWCFRTLDVEIAFGEYRPDPNDAAWGLDMLAIGPHEAEGTLQSKGDGDWARPSWATNAEVPDCLPTDRPILIEGNRPLLPGASVRGPLRHAFSRLERAAGRAVRDPHLSQRDVGEDDPAGKVFGTVSKSSRILIRDGRADTGWAAAKLHMHAEDEFSAGSYGSAKRDAVRVLNGVFPVRIVIEGPTPEEVEPLVSIVDRLVALGALGHLPVGGHKTRGAGWGRWRKREWINEDVKKTRDWSPPQASSEPETAAPHPSESQRDFIECPEDTEVWVKVTSGCLDGVDLSLGEAARFAMRALNDRLVAWWCEPAIDLTLTNPPATFGRAWPAVGDKLQVDEATFYAQDAVWRAARTATGVRYVYIEEVAPSTTGAVKATAVHTPARLHDFRRFSSQRTGPGRVLLREWRVADQELGFTIATVKKEED